MMTHRLISSTIRLCTLAIVLILLGPAARAQAPSPAQTPPMGWNSWNHFACKVKDADVRAAADAMVSTGMQGRRLRLRQYRRLLAGQARREGRHSSQREVPGHEGAVRLRSRPRA